MDNFIITLVLGIITLIFVLGCVASLIWAIWTPWTGLPLQVFGTCAVLVVVFFVLTGISSDD